MIIQTKPSSVELKLRCFGTFTDLQLWSTTMQSNQYKPCERFESRPESFHKKVEHDGQGERAIDEDCCCWQ